MSAIASNPQTIPSHRDSRISLLLAIMLAALGLMGALIAWRVGASADIAARASLTGLIVARDLATEEAAAQGTVAQTSQAWLAYETQRRLAVSLRAAGYPDAALAAAKSASANWLLVRPEYIDSGGNYHPDKQYTALLAEAASATDLDPAPHFAIAAAEDTRIHELLAVGVLLGLALPLLTAAEVMAARGRTIAALIGGSVFAIGLIALLMVWL